MTSVSLAFQRLEAGRGATDARSPGKAGSTGAGRVAALLLLSYYLPAAAWALKQHKLRYLIYSAPFAVALWAALKGRSQGS